MVVMGHLLNAMKGKCTLLLMLEHRVDKVNNSHNLNRNRHLGQGCNLLLDSLLQLQVRSQRKTLMVNMGVVIHKVLGSAGLHPQGRISFLFNLGENGCHLLQGTTRSHLWLLVEWEVLQKEPNLEPCGKVEEIWATIIRGGPVLLQPARKDLVIILGLLVEMIWCIQTSDLATRASGHLMLTGSSPPMCLPLAHL